MTTGKIIALVAGTIAFLFFMLTVVLGIIAYFVTIQRTALIGRKMNKRFHKRIEKYGIDYSWFDENQPEKMMIENEGLKLCGFLVRAKKFSNKVAIINHGYFQNHKDMQVFAQLFLEKGYNVFMPDARAHGESEGNTVGMGWLDRKDLSAWINVMIEVFGKEAKIVLFGVSMGAATCCMTAGEQLPKNVKCVISDCVYDSAYSQFAYVLKKRTFLGEFPVIKIANRFAKWIGKYSLRDASTIKQVAKTKLPILFIHGSKDNFVPAYMSHNLFHTVKPNLREIYISNGADHLLAYKTNPKEYSDRVDKWLEKWVK